MFDSKSLLENLVRGAAPQAQGQAQGGLAEILSQLTNAARGAAGGQGGGIDIMRELEKITRAPSANVAADNRASPSPSASSGGSAGAGGLNDVLGQLKEQLGKAGASTGLQGGGIMDVLGKVLSQATQGVKEGAGRIDTATGASDTLGKALGRSPQDVLAQLQQIIRDNPLAAGAAMGGLGGLVLGTRTGRAVAGSAAKVGAWALIGGLAYKAFQNYQSGKPLLTGATDIAEAPQGSGFEPSALTNESAALYIKAMIAAAAADGRLDGVEQDKIVGNLKQAGLDRQAEEFLADVFNAPPSPEELAAAVTSPEEAVQVYTAARIAIEPDTAAEKNFLSALAGALGIDDKLAAHIDAQARSAAS